MISGIAVCNACLKPCKVEPHNFEVRSECCKVTVVHKNVKLTLEASGST